VTVPPSDARFLLVPLGGDSVPPATIRDLHTIP
jgi:hypothetical protein